MLIDWREWHNQILNTKRVNGGFRLECPLDLDLWPDNIIKQINSDLSKIKPYYYRGRQCLQRTFAFIRLRFGLEDGQYWTYQAIADEFGLTSVRVGQAIQDGIRILSKDTRGF